MHILSFYNITIVINIGINGHKFMIMFVAIFTIINNNFIIN